MKSEDPKLLRHLPGEYYVWMSNQCCCKKLQIQKKHIFLQWKDFKAVNKWPGVYSPLVIKAQNVEAKESDDELNWKFYLKQASSCPRQ